MVKFLPAGDKCIQVNLGDEISLEIHQKVRKYLKALEEGNVPGVTELVPTYCGINIYYNPLESSYDLIMTELTRLSGSFLEMEPPRPQVVEIPTCYEGKFGTDLAFVAEHNGLTPPEVIQLHSQPEYLIYMLGFSPGFCYLGGLPKKIATPRLAQPRAHIPAGSVGIAGSQTGIYPVESPGGWRIIGKTPIQLYNPYRENNQILLKAGDYIKFVPISEDEFNVILHEIKEDKYAVKKYLKRD
jgi:KipI family sensor histidine kinase inhibitor